MGFSETITRDKEEQRHVEYIYESETINRKIGMSQYHEDDADAFSKGHGIVILYIVIHHCAKLLNISEMKEENSSFQQLRMYNPFDSR